MFDTILDLFFFGRKYNVSYKEDNKQRYEIVQVIAEDFNELKNEWLNFICDIFSEVF